MSDLVIKAENLKKVYTSDIGGETIALRGVDIQIERGRMVAVMGPSGSGKSSLLHVLGGIDTPTEGKVTIDGRDITAMTDRELAAFRNHHVGFVFQFHYLLSEFSALENTAMPLLIRGEKDAIKKAEEILNKLGLSHRLNHRPSMLSGGEQQRVAIARAVVTRPKILIADEPTGNLDSENARNVIQMIKDISQQTGMTVIIATHDIEIARYCEYIYYLKDGHIVGVEKH